MRSILIVDDQSRIRATYRQILTKDGYYVLEASNADEANEILKNETIDLMLLDIKMPRVSGRILYEIKRMFHQETKVVVCSVYPLEDQKQIIRGADDYFDKSEGLVVLRQKVLNLLGDDSPEGQIVIIDDEQRIRILYTHLFGKAGYLVKAFGDNKAAVRYLSSAETWIDLLILDLAMPDIDGRQFFEMVKKKHPETKMLIASNYGLETQKYLVYGADDYYDKTDGNASLLKKAKSLIKDSKVKGGAR